MIKTLIFLLLTLTPVYAKNRTSTHKWVYDMGSGAGFALDGKILTAGHICGNELFLKIYTNNNKIYHARVLKIDFENDLCLLKGFDEGFKLAEKPAKSVKIYTRHMIKGGKIIEKDVARVPTPYGFISTIANITDIDAQYGDSGSPALGDDGAVVGMVFALNSENYKAVLITLESIKNFVHD